MSVLIEIVVATFFTLLITGGQEVKQNVAEKTSTDKVCKIYFSEEC